MAGALNSRGVEEWRVVPSIPVMLASSWGRIMRKPFMAGARGGKCLRWYRSKPTYGVTRSAKKGAAHTYKGYRYRTVGNVKVHRLVCEAFHGPAPEGKNVVIHVNEDAHDNRPENLRWGTQKENLNAPGFLRQIAFRAVKLSPEQAREIRRRAASGEKQVSIANDMGISFRRVSEIVRFVRRCDILDEAA